MVSVSDRRLTLLHTSDLHIGSDVYPQEALVGFDQVCIQAKDRKVDAVLVAGDLFDSFRAPLESVEYVFAGLKELDRPIFVLPGNHDTLLTGAFGVPDNLPPLPANIVVLKEPAGETVSSPELLLSVWGRPVYDHEPSFQPLAGLPSRPANSWFVAMAHGLVMDGRTGSARSSPITVEELSDADCDYIALGHVHVFRDVTQNGPVAFYCGAPSGAQRRTAALVTLDPLDGASVETLPLN